MFYERINEHLTRRAPGRERTYGGYRVGGSIGDPGLSFLRSFLVFLGSKAFGQQCVEVIVVIPVVEGIKLFLGLRFGLGSDLELEAVREVGLGRDMGKKMRNVGEGRGLGAETAGQFDGNLSFYCFWHVGNVCGGRLISIEIIRGCVGAFVTCFGLFEGCLADLELPVPRMKLQPEELNCRAIQWHQLVQYIAERVVHTLSVIYGVMQISMDRSLCSRCYLRPMLSTVCQWLCDGNGQSQQTGK